MTQADWMALQSPLEMIRAAGPGYSDRKLILAYAASARELSAYLNPGDFTELIDLAEKRADGDVIDPEDEHRIDWFGESTMWEYDAKWIDMQGKGLPYHLLNHFSDTNEWVNNHVSASAIGRFIYGLSRINDLSSLDRYRVDDYFNPGHVLDVFGNAIANRSFDNRWRNEGSATIAHSMYDIRDFSAMPILADAFEDAGCDDAAILAHCRDPQAIHVRGCWVVDLVLGKN